MHTQTLTNAENGQEYYLPAGSLVIAKRTSGNGTTTLRMKDGFGDFDDVEDVSGNVIQISAPGVKRSGIAVSGVYRFEQTGTAVTQTSLRAGG